MQLQDLSFTPSVITFREYPNGAIMDEECFEELDNELPIYDNYREIEINEDEYQYMSEIIPDESKFLSWIASHH